MDFSEIFTTGSVLKKLLGAFGVILFLRLLPIILQGSGTFGSQWIKEDICSSIKPEPFCCNKSRCGKGQHLSDIEGVSFDFHVASFVFLLLPICCDCCIYCSGDKESLCLSGTVVLVSHMIAGLCNVIGFICFWVKISGNFTLGSSAYQCLLGIIYVFFVSCMCILCCKDDKKGKETNEAV